MKLGYCRVSTDDQHLDAQRAALTAAGVERIYEEKESGGRWDRPVLHELLRSLRPGDEVLVVRLDRLSRSVRDTLTILERIGEVGAGFRSLTEGIETVSPAGRMLTTMLAAFAEYERAILRQRTRDGLAAAKRRGSCLGRRQKLSPVQRQAVIQNVTAGTWTRAEAARIMDVDPATITRVMASAAAT
ncbi:recombinase family protein [Azospirillum isscasi]|uniref:Recombinase family protein n=1 Tax=Azospirillum isscasi TaxID=3053926 RepID=A0ABU0WJM2_9PROT|nr:recombinase family protein [Azospirillum isscasi]MDQ2104429.1 recombinase family protein [Azospirillum isscasi]